MEDVEEKAFRSQKRVRKVVGRRSLCQPLYPPYAVPMVGPSWSPIAPPIRLGYQSTETRSGRPALGTLEDSAPTGPARRPAQETESRL